MTTVFTVIGVKKLIYQTLQDDYGVLPNGGGSLGGGVVTGGLTQAQVQTLIDTAIAGVPQSAGVTLQQVEASIAAAVSNLPAPGLGEPAVLELLEEKLTEFGPMIQQAIQSQFKAMPKSIRLNTDDGKVSIEGLDISGPNKPVSLDMELPDGSLSVNGRRVLTVDDAIDPSGVDAAAVEAAVAAATSQLTTKTEYQSLINALCSAPFAGMAGNVTNNVNKVGVWVGIVKQEIENLEANLVFAYEKTVENKTSIAGVQDRVTALEGAALSGDGVSQAVIDSLLARVDALGDCDLTAVTAALRSMQTDVDELKADKSAPVDVTALNSRVRALEASVLNGRPTPDPELVRISNTAVGNGEYVVTPSKTMGATYTHTPGEHDDYLVVFAGFTIPDVVPGGSVWNITVKYGTQTLTQLGAALTGGSHPTDKTRGEVRAYGAAITPGKGPQEVVVTCTTGTDLAGKANNPTYTFASNSVSVSNYASHTITGTANSGDTDGYNVRARYRRLIGMSQVATTPAKTYVQSGAGGPARVLWESSDNGGRRVVVFEDACSPDSMIIMYGGNTANRYASGSVTFDVLAPPKVL